MVVALLAKVSESGRDVIADSPVGDLAFSYPIETQPFV